MAIMHLTNNTPKGDSPHVASEPSEAAGAPAIEDRSYLSLPFGEVSAGPIEPDPHFAMREAFRDWWGENADALEDGGTGDIQSLFAALCAVSQNSA